MQGQEQQLREALVAIAAETFRLRQVFERAISRLEEEEQARYMSQYGWFSRRVNRAMEQAGLRLLDPAGQLYDPGMAVTPLNLEEFEPQDRLYVEQTIEPIVMGEDQVLKTGTVILGRIEK